jgi:hypothetical protein
MPRGPERTYHCFGRHFFHLHVIPSIVTDRPRLQPWRWETVSWDITRPSAWWWRQKQPLKRRSISTTLHSSTTCKTDTFAPPSWEKNFVSWLRNSNYNSKRANPLRIIYRLSQRNINENNLLTLPGFDASTVWIQVHKFIAAPTRQAFLSIGKLSYITIKMLRARLLAFFLPLFRDFRQCSIFMITLASGVRT